MELFVSFDLEVYGERSLSPDQIAEVVVSVGGLVAHWDAEGASIAAVRHADSDRHCLTLDGPFDVEGEDVPEGWQTALSGVTVLYQIHADVGEENVRCALAFSRMFASRVAGRVLDPQNDETPRLRSAPPVKPGDGQFLHLHWFRPGGIGEDAAAIYLEVARELMPLAVPGRFGPHEPFQGSLPRDGDAAFDRMYRRACAGDRMYFVGKEPSLGGYIDSWGAPNPKWPVDLMVTFDFGGLERVGAVSEITGFFVEVARRIGSFSAYVELNDAAYATAAPLQSLGRWAGLPDEPQWLTWYSAEYAALVHPYLTGGVARSFPEGLLHQWSDAPTTAEQLRPSLTRVPWVPEALLPLRSPFSRRRLLRAADEMPESLRTS